MGEAWSDWYAKDFLAREGFQDGRPGGRRRGLPGPLHRRRPARPDPHPRRSTASPAAIADACPGGADVDQRRRARHRARRLHLRRLRRHRGRARGPRRRRDLGADAVGPARRHSRAPTSPSSSSPTACGCRRPSRRFLDMRNAILAADEGGQRAAPTGTSIWSVFAGRGHGLLRGGRGRRATSTPAEDFATPPAADGPTGTIRGTRHRREQRPAGRGRACRHRRARQRSAFGDYFAADDRQRTAPTRSRTSRPGRTRSSRSSRRPGSTRSSTETSSCRRGGTAVAGRRGPARLGRDSGGATLHDERRQRRALRLRRREADRPVARRRVGRRSRPTPRRSEGNEPLRASRRRRRSSSRRRSTSRRSGMDPGRHVRRRPDGDDAASTGVETSG